MLKRQFISFGGKCSFGCNHCYTFSRGDRYDAEWSVGEIVESLSDKDFEIVYVSGHREPFIDPDEGLDLCRRVFERYGVDILLTTRATFNNSQLVRLEQLFKVM
jgi:pyruvate-formate lyase-activating enzyme